VLAGAHVLPLGARDMSTGVLTEYPEFDSRVNQAISGNET
jgi:hypothetical protein